MIPLTISKSFSVGSQAASSSKSLTRKIGELTAVEPHAEPGDGTIALVEDNERARDALAFQLSTAGYHVVPFASGHGLLAQCMTDFDCIVADVFLPRMNGLQLQERLINTGNSVSIVFITGRGDLAIGVRAMKRGAVDVLEKPIDDAALLNAVIRGVERSRAERVRHEHHAALQERFRSLPARQRDVFTLITAGLLNKQVAAELGISERTVKVHRERLRRKMGADSLAELARMAEMLGLQPPSPSSGQNWYRSPYFRTWTGSDRQLYRPPWHLELHSLPPSTLAQAASGPMIAALSALLDIESFGHSDQIGQ